MSQVVNLSEFENEKKQLINIFQAIKDSPFVPLDTPGFKVDQDTIDQWIRKLEEGEFIVSVCGQVKAGKSTFLNLLIFEDEVLPTASTPETTKLTILRYREKPLIKVHFYSEEDLNQLKNYFLEEVKNSKNGRKSYYEEYIAKPLEKRINEGRIPLDFESQTIREKEREIFPQSLEDLRNQLREFVGAEGACTPLVKHVEVFYPSPFLKKITIVDTPGLNDPNPARSEETKRWMSRSDAVIYLIYAGQPFHLEDKNFFSEFLVGNVHPSRVIVVLSKADLCENLNEVEAYVRNTFKTHLGENGEEFFREVPIFPVASYITLIKRQREKFGEDHPEVGKKLEELEKRAEADPAVERCWEEGDKWLENLIQAIEKHLCEVKGQDILQSAWKKTGAFEQGWFKKFEEEEKLLQHQYDTLQLDLSELEKRSQELDKYERDVESKLKTLQEDALPKLKEDFRRELWKFIDKKFEELEKKVLSEALTDEKSDNVKTQMICTDFAEKFSKRISEEIEKIFKNIADNLMKTIDKVLFEDMKGKEFIIPLVKTIIKIQKSFFFIPSDEIKKDVKTYFLKPFQEFKKRKKWFIFDDHKGTQKKFKQELGRTKEKINEYLPSRVFHKRIELKFKEEIIAKIVPFISKEIESLEKRRKEIEQGLKTKEQILKEIEENLNSIRKKMKDFQSFMTEIKSLIKKRGKSYGNKQQKEGGRNNGSKRGINDWNLDSNSRLLYLQKSSKNPNHRAHNR